MRLGFPASRVHMVPGLWNNTQNWAVCVGRWMPRILVDPGIATKPGETAMVVHEIAHARGRHALIGDAILWVAALATLVPVSYGVGMEVWGALWWVLGTPISLGFWVWWQKISEVLADRYAIWVAGEPEYRKMLWTLNDHRKDWLDRWAYGRDRRDRYRRAVRKDMP